MNPTVPEMVIICAVESISRKDPDKIWKSSTTIRQDPVIRNKI